jgi:GT2 family glycosyltransferase
LERKMDLICLLNNDLVLQETALRLLTSTYTRLGSCLLHPSIYYYSDPNSPQLDPLTTGSTTGGIIGKLPTSDDEDVWELDHAYGACLMVGTEIFRRIGLLDERFFLQMEETDLFLRAQRQGLKAVCVPSARVLHKESVAFGGRRIPIKTYYGIRNSLLLTEKNTTFGSRKFFTYLKRRLYWHLRSLHREIGSGSFLHWLLSADAFAVAVRRGVLDYATRRFGRVNPNSARAIDKALATRP